MKVCDVLVIGGGVTGCAAAYHLARLGADVVLCERFDLNTQASGRNAGSLHGQIPHASFVERGEDWGRGFLPTLRLLSESLKIWRDLSDELGTDLEVSLCGGLLVAETATQMADIERKVALERSVGVESEMLDAADLQRIAPYAAPTLVGAQLCLTEGKANPLLVAPAFAASAREMGARVLTDTEVVDVQRVEHGYEAATPTGAIAAKRIVFASGDFVNDHTQVWSAAPLTVTHEALQVSATEPVAPILNHLVYFAGGKLTLKQAKAGSLLIGGGWPADAAPDRWSSRVNPTSLSGNMEVALRVMPALANVRVIRSWSGFAPVTPDLAPIIGRVGPGLVVGLVPHFGLTAGPLVGLILAQLALELPTATDVGMFAPDLSLVDPTKSDR